MVENLVLVENVFLGNITIVMATDGNHLKRDLAQHVGKEDGDVVVPDKGIGSVGEIAREKKGIEQGLGGNQDWEVDQIAPEDRKVRLASRVVDVSSNVKDDEGGEQRTNGNEQFLESKGKAQTNETLLGVGNLTANFVVTEVVHLSPPRISPNLGNPDEEEHNVTDPWLVFKVKLVDDVVLNLVQDGDSEGDDRHSPVNGQLTNNVGVNRSAHNRETAKEQGKTNLVLVLEPSVLGADVFIFDKDSTTDRIDLFLFRDDVGWVGLFEFDRVLSCGHFQVTSFVSSYEFRFKFRALSFENKENRKKENLLKSWRADLIGSVCMTNKIRVGIFQPRDLFLNR